MGRLRSRLAVDQLNQAAQMQMSKAAAALQQAMNLCVEQKKADGSGLNQQAKDGEQALLSILAALSKVALPASGGTFGLDQELQRQVGKAAEALQNAASVYKHSLRLGDGLESRSRARRNEQAIRAALSALGGVRSLVPSLVDDPDLVPEDWKQATPPELPQPEPILTAEGD